MQKNGWKENEVTSDKSEGTSNLSRDENNGRNITLGMGKASGGEAKVEPTTDSTNRPITERINNADNNLEEVSKTTNSKNT